MSLQVRTEVLKHSPIRHYGFEGSSQALSPIRHYGFEGSSEALSHTTGSKEVLKHSPIRHYGFEGSSQALSLICHYRFEGSSEALFHTSLQVQTEADTLFLKPPVKMKFRNENLMPVMKLLLYFL
jgi:hypothetical protein